MNKIGIGKSQLDAEARMFIETAPEEELSPLIWDELTGWDPGLENKIDELLRSGKHPEWLVEHAPKSVLPKELRPAFLDCLHWRCRHIRMINA